MLELDDKINSGKLNREKAIKLLNELRQIRGLILSNQNHDSFDLSLRLKLDDGNQASVEEAVAIAKLKIDQLAEKAKALTNKQSKWQKLIQKWL
ncbi:hypothetical protein [Pedobacter miscanthi]|uniref:hypothetical protein n=1 Tax=Pedobacter miscanthi TaxID=2259170 RepID=UPI00292EC141|nr:hypothetical protein [Pedobacter miscanthi]